MFLGIFQKKKIFRKKKIFTLDNPADEPSRGSDFVEEKWNSLMESFKQQQQQDALEEMLNGKQLHAMTSSASADKINRNDIDENMVR